MNLKSILILFCHLVIFLSGANAQGWYHDAPITLGCGEGYFEDEISNSLKLLESKQYSKITFDITDKSKSEISERLIYFRINDSLIHAISTFYGETKEGYTRNYYFKRTKSKYQECDSLGKSPCKMSVTDRDSLNFKIATVMWQMVSTGDTVLDNRIAIEIYDSKGRIIEDKNTMLEKGKSLADEKNWWTTRCKYFGDSLIVMQKFYFQKLQSEKLYKIKSKVSKENKLISEITNESYKANKNDSTVYTNDKYVEKNFEYNRKGLLENVLYSQRGPEYIDNGQIKLERRNYSLHTIYFK